jgi:hypothetical protein
MKSTPPSELVKGRLYIIKTNTNQQTVCLRFVHLFECNGSYASFRDDNQAPNTLATGFHVDGHIFFDYETLSTPLTHDIQHHIKTFF